MSGLFSSDAKVLVIGANHRSSSLALRDRLFLDEAEVIPFLDRLKAAGVEQSLVVSTCDRVEVHAVDHNPDKAIGLIIDILAERAELDVETIRSQLYIYQDQEAVRHIFRVTASLDSLMVGEPQVVGQVKDAHRWAVEAGTVGTELERIFQAAYGTAKRVRSETAVGERPVSIASVAVQIAKELHGDLDRCRGLLIGAGDMGELTAQNLIEAGLKDFTCIHSFDGRAKMIARNLSCHAESFDARDRLAAEADIILTSMNKRSRVVTKDMVAYALKVRKNKPIFLIDTGIPGDIDPGVNDVDGAFLYDLHDLEQVAMEGRASREAEARAAATILEKDLNEFFKGKEERVAVPLVTSLRDRFEQERQSVLASCGDDADKATRLLINRLLHTPSEELRSLAALNKKKEWEKASDLISKLFLKEK
ncbi:glutamyl-tRNA reductase [Terasakiella sp. A23]|uniref:glutamyl-tRNA reductase n=1 Tax=Terasakiella sp. FCG-A23 TaxID=3080561 RepID=UPI002954CDD7|nr:glutamyl-tRNA reductase [Terasakiella sp. A23]MDV7339778.1 glutamyl-tRNA reductase [Terasakiella sp. A23]